LKKVKIIPLQFQYHSFNPFQGDSKEDWRMEEFRMFKGGSLWKPPVKNLFVNGMPDHLVELDDW